MLRVALVGLVFALAVVGGCEGNGSEADGGPGIDGGGPVDSGGADAAQRDAGEADAGQLDGSQLDGGQLDGAPLDGSATDGGAPTSCEAAGGTCVAVVPSACPTGILGNGEWYSCGTGVGVTCCLPSTTPPACREIGTASEGWYAADGTRICNATCAGASVACEAVGTRSEGWYTDVASAACTTPPVARLVEWADCSP